MKLAGEAVEYVSATSSPTSYKYSIIASILLAGIDHTEYEVIDTVSGTVRDYVETFSQFMFADGYKEKWIALNNLVKKDSDLLYAALLVMVNDVETALKCEEPSDATKYLLAGMAYIEVSLRKSAITVPNRQYELYNRFMALLMRNAKF